MRIVELLTEAKFAGRVGKGMTEDDEVRIIRTMSNIFGPEVPVRGRTAAETIQNVIYEFSKRTPLGRAGRSIIDHIISVVNMYNTGIDPEYREMLETLSKSGLKEDLDISGSYLDDDAKKQLIIDFIHWSAAKIHLKNLPEEILFSDNQADARENHHTGSYDWHNNQLWVYVGHRNLVDILRTLCHELVHAKQDQEGRIKRHSPPGSKLEREADETAGYLIKLFGAEHREIFQ